MTTRTIGAVVALLCLGATAPVQPSDRPGRFDQLLSVPEALQAALSLDESQVGQLDTINDAMRASVRPLARAAAQIQRSLIGQMQAETPNETIVGALTLAVEQISNEIESVTSTYREQARAILRPDQLEALAPIESAAMSWHVVRDAASYNLVAIPEAGRASFVGRGSRTDRFGGLVAVPDALQTALVLDESQIVELRAIDQALQEEVRPLVQTLTQTRRDLSRAMAAETPNETIVGALTLAIEQISSEISAVTGTYQAQARWVLSEEQILALAPIEEAAAHWYTVQQAAALNLVDIPEASDAVPARGGTGGGRDGADGNRGRNDNDRRRDR